MLTKTVVDANVTPLDDIVFNRSAEESVGIGRK